MEDPFAELGGEVLPYERTPFPKELLDGEGIVFYDDIIGVSTGNKPGNLLFVSPDKIRSEFPFVGKYLWIIDRRGLRLLLESTPNPRSRRGYVCHTNITGGERAMQGGELWFGTDDKVYINNKSGRYGATTATQVAAVQHYFQLLGFDVVQLPWKQR